MSTVRSFLVASSLALAACTGAPAELGDDDIEAIDDGKADNYFSTSAREYWAEGGSQVVVEPGLKTAAARLARAKELMQLKAVAIGWFLNVRLTDKEAGTGEHGDANAASYPGYHAIVRTGDFSLTNLKAAGDGATYTFDVKLQVAGQQNLITKLPGTALSGSRKKVTLQMGKVANADLAKLDPEHEWFRDDPWDSGAFDPKKLTEDQLETVDLTFSAQDDEDDAYFDLKKLFSDGKLTIDAHYGWDYWDRYDLANAQDLYDRLVADGFDSPAKSFDAYLPDDGPLTKTRAIAGKDVTIEVRIFHNAGKGAKGYDAGSEADGIAWEKQVLKSLAEKEVVIFSGHSGQYYGFALSDWKKTDRGAVDYPALSSATMPRDRYQIVLASGCNTFSTGEAFRQNASKPDFKNLNVVTTNTFSDAGSNEEVFALFAALFGAEQSTFAARPISTMLRKMNGSGMGAMFGVHGVDGDPRLHPFADVAKLGDACTANGDCGGDGNRCTKVGQKRVCSAACVADDACPGSFKCKQVAATGTSTIVGRQCLK